MKILYPYFWSSGLIRIEKKVGAHDSKPLEERLISKSKARTSFKTFQNSN
jgi:hypothetical protein